MDISKLITFMIILHFLFYKFILKTSLLKSFKNFLEKSRLPFSITLILEKLTKCLLIPVKNLKIQDFCQTIFKYFSFLQCL